MLRYTRSSNFRLQRVLPQGFSDSPWHCTTRTCVRLDRSRHDTTTVLCTDSHESKAVGDRLVSLLPVATIVVTNAPTPNRTKIEAPDNLEREQSNLSHQNKEPGPRLASSSQGPSGKLGSAERLTGQLRTARETIHKTHAKSLGSNPRKECRSSQMPRSASQHSKSVAAAEHGNRLNSSSQGSGTGFCCLDRGKCGKTVLT